MKLSHKIFSHNGILVATLLSLMVAAWFCALSILAATQGNSGDLWIGKSDTVTTYVLDGVMGRLSSTTGTYQTWGLFIAYVVTPFLASLMFAIRASLGLPEDDIVEGKAEEDSLPATRTPRAYAA